MDYVYDRCESALASGPYLAGGMYSLADIAILPYVHAFKEVRPELMTTHPRTRAWFERVMARPAVQATYCPPRRPLHPRPPLKPALPACSSFIDTAPG